MSNENRIIRNMPDEIKGHCRHCGKSWNGTSEHYCNAEWEANAEQSQPSPEGADEIAEIANEVRRIKHGLASIEHKIAIEELAKRIESLQSKQAWATDDDMKHAMNFGSDYAHNTNESVTMPSADRWLTQYKQQKGIV